MTTEEYINLFNEYYRWVINECKNVMNLSKEDAEDITMQLFMQLWDNLPSINKSTVKTLLTKSARNKCIDHLRQKKLHVAYVKKNDNYSPIEDELKKIEKKNLISHIQSIIETLPSKQQKIIKLTYLHDYTRIEVSSELKTNPLTIRNGLQQGMKNLKNKLNKQNITRHH